MNAPFAPPATTLVVIPTLNEAAHIRPLLDFVLAEADTVPLTVVVVDGGSTDGTREAVADVAARDPRVRLLANPDRIQSSGINRAVFAYGRGVETLIRLDAHSRYAPGYVRQLAEEAEATRADSVVVGMRTVGTSWFSRAVAAAQNSRLGSGDSAHRIGGRAGEVDHGHHALMRIDRFAAVGGYDRRFSHNEDGELDHRLRQAGSRIWLTDRVAPVYVPRDTPGTLWRQYRNYGRGRARTILKHRVRPKPRQALPALVAPAVAAATVGGAMAPLVPAAALLAAPAAAWAGLSLAYGAALAARGRSVALLAAGPAAMVMHLAWSVGFLEGLVRYGAAR